MLKQIKNIFKKEKQNIHEVQKEIIVCIHGFGVRQSHEYDNFKLWGKNDFDFHTFDIYVYQNEDDNDPSAWITRCEQVVENFINNNYKVSLIGFSMGGVIATHLAAKYKIERLFLIAPAFEYFTANNIISKTKEAIKHEEIKKPILPPNFTPCFVEVVKRCKPAIKNVDCPVCVVHGNEDEVIPYKSSIKIMNDIPHEHKRLFIINNGVHRMMMQKECGYDIYQIFKLFMNKVILPDEEVIFSKDIF